MTAPATTVVADAACPGIGTVPATPQIAVVHRDGLYALDERGSERCLIRGEQGAAKWAPTGNRVLFNGKVHYSSRRAPTTAPELDVNWSRPRGTSFVGLDDGCLQKWPVDGDERGRQGIGDCSIDSFAYHPAGKHIALGALGSDGYGIYIATNTGEGMRLVTKGESATRISEMAFSQDGERLYFLATHDGESHLHRLDLNTAKIETLATAKEIGDLHVSPIGGVAWRTGNCSGDPAYETFVLRSGKRIVLPESLRGTVVVGWTTPETMIFFKDTSCGTAEEHAVYRWSPGGEVEHLTDGVLQAAIRAPLPPAPGPPPSTVFDIPESAAPA